MVDKSMVAVAAVVRIMEILQTEAEEVKITFDEEYPIEPANKERNPRPEHKVI